MTFTATDATPHGAEWPPGIHWSPGEARALPEGYPVPDGDAPAWLVPADVPPPAEKPPKGASRPSRG